MSSQSDSSVTSEVVNSVTEQTNVFMEYWNSIDWNGIVAATVSATLKIIFSLILFFILKKIGNFFINQAFENYRRRNSITPNRLNTLYNLSQNLFQAIIGFFLGYAILSSVGIPVGTLLAGAGVIGLALSLGAQGFVSDIVTGFFILLEKQIDVGDVVELDKVVGVVVDVNLKTTQVKSFDGTLNYVPNRYITIVSNKSREDMRVQIDIRLFPGTDIKKVNGIVEQVNAQMVPEYPVITQEPQNLGLIDIGNGQTGLRIVMFVENGNQYMVTNNFFQAYVTALSEAGIDIPVSNFNFLNK